MPDVSPIPPGHHTVTPHLVCSNASDAIAFYTQAFGAEEVYRMPAPDGAKLWHAEMKLGDSLIYLVDEFPEFGSKAPSTLGGSPVTLHLFFADVDAAFQRAVDAGATVEMPLDNMFWGDRMGKLNDPFGHKWSMAQHLEDVEPEEMQARIAKIAEEMRAQGS